MTSLAALPSNILKCRYSQRKQRNGTGESFTWSTPSLRAKSGHKEDEATKKISGLTKNISGKKMPEISLLASNDVVKTTVRAEEASIRVPHYLTFEKVDMDLLTKS